MWTILAKLLTGPIVEAFIGGYKAKLQAGNNSERIAADLAEKDLLLLQRERELATQITLLEDGRWWTAAPRAIVTWSFALYTAKLIVYDKMLGWGTTDPLTGDVAVWAGWCFALWFGGRTAEKIARIVSRR